MDARAPHPGGQPADAGAGRARRSLYLDAYPQPARARSGSARSRLEASMAADALASGSAPSGARRCSARSRAADRQPACGSTAPTARCMLDSWQLTGPTYQLRDPATQKWTKDVARALDRGFNALVGAQAARRFRRAGGRPAAGLARSGRGAERTGEPTTEVRNAPDLTPVISAAVPVGRRRPAGHRQRPRLHPHRAQPARGRSRSRMARGRSLLSVLLSLFLARTIVRPLRRLALAAHRVRLGRAREVNVPRLPSRSDEIGLLARAVRDMSQSLRHRIDNIEAFAADVTHELKNPLASLRSAVDGLDRVEDPDASQAADRRHPPGRGPARPADQRHRRGRADRRRAGPRAVRAGRPRRADRAAGRQLGNAARDRQRPHRLRPPAPGQRDRAWASPAGWRARSTISSTMRSASRRPAAWSRSPPRMSATKSASASTTKGPAFRPSCVRRFLTASIQYGPRARTSAAIRDSALPSPGRSSKAMTGRLTWPTATTRLRAPASPSRLPAADRA